MGIHLYARDAVASLRGSGPAELNWLFLVENIVVIILILFYFFYFNRIVGIFVSFILRLLLWKSHNAYFEIGGISFSLLGGGIIFNDVRYISRNQSLRIARGHVIWRYWLWRVRSEEDKASEARIPCRLSVSLHGAEWFLYNRTPSYDAILEQLGVLDPLSSWGGDASQSLSSEDLLKRESSKGVSIDELTDTAARARMGAPVQQAEKQAATDWLREALPIDIKCKTGAIIMGNPSTPTILIAGFDRVSGTYAAVKSRSQYDEYKQVYRLKFELPKIVFRTNPDYEGPMAEHGEEVLEKLESSPGFALADFLRRPTHFAAIHVFRSLLRKLPKLSKSAQKEADESPSRKPSSKKDDWTGLPRYQSANEGSGPSHRVEYAKVTTLLTSPELEMTYYCDTAGEVPKVPRVVTGFAGLETCDIGNGDLSPEWGVDLVIKGGIITYGPWADRQRSHLQQAFTPTTFFDQVETPKLKPGDQRMHTALKVFVEFSEGATLRVPTRETSKDWRYDSLDSSSVGDATVRPYGWLDVALGPNSTLSYVLPMVATAAGYDTLLELHLDEMSITSSVNYACFLRAETCRVHCGLPSPLAWDELRTWTINTTVSKPDISLLRDHITLLSDVAKDWTSGPPGDYEQFVPFLYAMNFKITDYTLRLFVNDHNIINNPTTIEDNTLLIARGPTLTAKVGIPSDRYRMNVSDIKFHVSLLNLALSMSLPDWNTHSAFLTEQTATFATSPELTIDGSYRFYATAQPDNVERLAIAVDCHDVVFKTMGWMVRHLFNLRDNYFGTFTHFVTLEEYRHRHERNLQGDPLELKYRPGQTDVFEVAVTLDLRNGLLLMPQEIYDCRSAVAFAIPQMQVDLRNHDYYMEMSLNIDPLRIMETLDADALIKEDFASLLELSDCIAVQGLEVTANRLFGPQPRTATYMCIWSFYLGAVVGSIPPSFLQAFARAGNSVGLGFVDQDNSLPPDFNVALDPDATFLTVDMHSIDLAIRGQGTAIQLSLSEGVTIRFDDLACAPFLKHIAVEIPTVTLRALAPLFGRAAPWMEVASIDADFSIVLGLSETGWAERAKTQLEFIAAQDALTQRCPFIYGKGPGVSTRLGGLFLPALAAPTRMSDLHGNHDFVPSPRRRPRPRQQSSGIYDDDESGDSEGGYDSDTSEDDYHSLYQRLPGRADGGDRFSAYGAILRLCERAPEASLLDRPTFRRLPLADDAPQTDSSLPSSPRDLPSLDERLEKFGTHSYTKPVSRTAVDVTCRSPIRVVLTPVSVQVGADVMDGLIVDKDLERCLDELFDGYVSSQGSVPTVRYSDLEVKASIPSVQIESIQDVLRPEEAISFKQQRPEEKDTGSGSTILCTVRLTLDDITFACQQRADGYGGVDEPTVPLPSLAIERKFGGSAGRTRLEVFHPPHSTTLPSRRSHTLPSTPACPRPRPTALDLVFGLCEAQLDFAADRALVSLKGGDARLDFVDEAAELVIGTVWSWRVVHDIAGPLRERAAQRKVFERRLVWAIALVSQQAAITSFPTFLNRASYLVSRANLRADDGWKTLHHLRHCLRAAPEDVARNMAQPPPWPSSSSLLADLTDVLARWQNWGIDAEDLTRSRFLTSLFGSSAALPSNAGTPSTDLTWSTPAAFEWRAGRFDALLSDGTTSENRLSIGPGEAFISSTGRQAEGAPIHIRGRFTLHELGANVDRDLLVLIRHIIKVRYTFERKLQRFAETLALAQSAAVVDSASRLDVTKPDFLSSIPHLLVDASMAVRRTSASALADNLEAKAVIDDIALTSSLSFNPRAPAHLGPGQEQLQVGSSLTIGHLEVAAREIAQEQEHLLLSTELDQLALLVNAVGSQASDHEPTIDPPSLQVVLAVQGVSSRIPRDAVRAYEFVEKWKTSALPEYDSLLTELRLTVEEAHPPVAKVVASPNPSAPPGPIQRLIAEAHLSAQVIVPLFSLEVQAIPTLKIGYSVDHFSMHASSSQAPQPGAVLGAIDVGLHVGAQTVRFIPVTDAGGRTSTLPAETAFHLPVVRLGAQLDGFPCRRVQLLATVDSVSVKLTADIIDNILTVQQHFGKDVDELLDVIKARRARQAELLGGAEEEPTPEVAQSTQSAPVLIAWDARVALRGFKVGIEGPQATQWIEAALLEGHANSTTLSSAQVLHWQASVQNLALSLAQRHPDDASKGPTDRRYRLAFFRLDLSASNAVINLPELPPASVYGDNRTPHLHLRLPRVHAVIQPSAIEALGDLVDYYQEQIEERRTSRRQDLEALQERVVQTFDEINDEDQNARSWLASCVVSLEMQSIGMAIPLNDDGIPAPDARHRRGKSAQSRPAFLLTIPSLKFATQKGSAGYARVSNFALQFVSDFDQGRKEDFDGSTHQSLNRVLLPEMKSTVRAATNGPVFIHSQVSGLEIDLEPTVVAFAFSLIDVYRLSHERFAKFALQTTATAPSTSPLDEPAPSAQSDPTTSPPASRPPTRAQSTVPLQASLCKRPSKPEAAPDTVRLPSLSVWADYQETTEDDFTRLHVNIVIHASNNTLYPTLIPFISDVASQLKDRALRSPSSTSAPELATLKMTSITGPSITAPPTDSLGRLKVGVSLKVDQSRLEISCLPAAEVTARLTWESGGFLLTLSPDTRGIDFAVTVDGVAAGLRHSFSPEDCLLAEAKGIAASVSFKGAKDPSPTNSGVLSAVVNLPDVAAEMNFRHLQDWLCLKAVWLDRMDLGPADTSTSGGKSLVTSTPPSTPTCEGPASSASSSRVTTLVHVQVAKFRFLCDLGQAIGRFTFVADTITSRLRLVPNESKNLSMGVKKLELVGQGRAGGSVVGEGLLFETRLRNEGKASKASDLLHVQIGLGKVKASVEYEFHKILVVDSDPIAIVVGDDWSRATTDAAELELDFKVKMGSFNIIATTATIPTLASVAQRVSTLIDEKGAQADATIAAAGLPPRPSTARKGENVVAAVASTLAQGPVPPGECPVRVINHLDIELVRIRVAIFPERFNEGEVYRLDAGSTIRAQLVRGVGADNIINRDLQLYLGFFSIRKVNHRKLSPTQEKEHTVPEWFELFRTSSERNIFKLGTTEVSMISYQAAGSNRLRHRFTMSFGGQVDIALNYALLRNLGSLATAYQQQMDQVTATGKTTSPYATAAPSPALPSSEGAGLAETVLSALPSESDIPSSRTIREEELPPSDDKLVIMKPSPLAAAATGDTRVLEFEAIESTIHQPQLNLLGDATPPLEWIGLQRARFPAWIHQSTTAPLEELLILLTKVAMPLYRGSMQKGEVEVQGERRAGPSA
ncbi:hypothetical protein BCR35DRAFT_353168 [Leucosporidium creatinivorum]|uniref:Uncharacterized protein n=1 Tax=Leucosporidium creatinivorum TaxID=106004 RepID=A0A1Y2F119_9BASI|nr:hypothetical protein BCR35DRAFT_353168 [Leucosporidium creatinivorum]